MSAVAVVVVNWNSGDDLVRCLASLSAQTHGCRIIVVDNASADGSAAHAENAEAVELIRLHTNRGFCGGANAGIAAAGGDVDILILNPDAWLDPAYLERALPYFDHDDVGFVAGKVLRADGVTIDTVGQTLSPVLRRVVERGYNELDHGQFEAPCSTPSVCGAVALYSRRLLAKLAPDGKLFDEDFFAFWEDADVGARARRAGFVGRYEPRSVAWHRRGGTRPRTRRILGRSVQLLGRDAEIQYHILKNRYLFLAKNEPVAGLALRAPVLCLVDGGVLALTAVLRPDVFRRLVRIGPLIRSAWRKRAGFR